MVVVLLTIIQLVCATFHKHMTLGNTMKISFFDDIYNLLQPVIDFFKWIGFQSTWIDPVKASMQNQVQRLFDTWNDYLRVCAARYVLPAVLWVTEYFFMVTPELEQLLSENVITAVQYGQSVAGNYFAQGKQILWSLLFLLPVMFCALITGDYFIVLKSIAEICMLKFTDSVAVQAADVEYAAKCEELHVVVNTSKSTRAARPDLVPPGAGGTGVSRWVSVIKKKVIDTGSGKKQFTPDKALQHMKEQAEEIARLRHQVAMLSRPGEVDIIDAQGVVWSGDAQGVVWSGDAQSQAIVNRSIQMREGLSAALH